MIRKYTFILICCCGLISILTACAGDSPKTQQGLLKLVFEAIKSNNSQEFNDLTITSADFVLDEYDAGHFQEKMSYVGQVLKPEELEIQASQFQRAVAGGEGYINFQQSKFLGSRLLEEGNYELISGSMIQYQTYSLILETNGQKQDSETLQPQFVITPWKKQYRLLGLKFAN